MLILWAGLYIFNSLGEKLRLRKIRVIHLPDYHIHTALCKHAVGDAAEYEREANGLRIPEICFTDHVPSMNGYDPEHRMALEAFSRYEEMVHTLQRKNGFPRILFGIEADYYEGCETVLAKWLSAHSFDLVLGSVHFINGWGFDNPDERHVWDSVDVTGTWQTYFEAVSKLAASGLFDAVGHLDLPKKFGYRPPERALREMIRPTLDRIASAGMGIEINTAGLRKPVKEIYPSAEILSMAREREIPICFGSDAHSPEDVGAGFDLAFNLAREAGYTHYFRINGREKRLVPFSEVVHHPVVREFV